MNYSILRDYLLHISRVFNLKICIHDFAGFFPADKELSTALQPFSIHNNDFCMCVKSRRQLWDKCLNGKEMIAEKLRNTHEPFYGMCHAGVEEFVIPVIYDGQIIAMINAGCFRSNEKKGTRRVKKIYQRYGLPEDVLIKHYFSSLSSNVPKIQDITNLLSIAADYLATAYSTLLSTHQGMLKIRKNGATENYVLNHVFEFIKRNYKKDIHVPHIAKFCHCSESYINHIFKSNMGINISQYINQIRINEAKTLLSCTDMKINSIAPQVGFSDPNYFSKVFKDLCNVPPSKYRKSKETDNIQGVPDTLIGGIVNEQ